MTSRFGITGIIDQVGETLTLKNINKTLSDRGSPTETITEHLVEAYVDEMSGEEKIVEEGHLGINDIIIFIDEGEDNIAYLRNGNRIVRGSKEFEIKNVIHNPGHFEVHCKRYR